jgi:hypothetical protein
MFVSGKVTVQERRLRMKTIYSILLSRTLNSWISFASLCSSSQPVSDTAQCAPAASRMALYFCSVTEINLKIERSLRPQEFNALHAPLSPVLAPIAL